MLLKATILQCLKTLFSFEGLNESFVVVVWGFWSITALQCVLVSTVQQCRSATCKHTSRLS